MVDIASPLEVRAPDGRGPLALILAGIRELAEVRCDGLDLPAVESDMVGIQRCIDLLQGELVRRVGRALRLRQVTPERPLSLIDWLRTECRLSGAAAAERVEVARRLAELDRTGEALARGDIGYEHARVIARTATELGPDAARQVEGDLLESAREVDPGRLRSFAQGVRLLADPGGAEEAARRLHEQRRVSLSRLPDGAFGLDGLLDAQAGATLTTALDALMTPTPGDRRSAVQRRADALVELARRQLGAGELPLVGGQRPHLTLLVPMETLRRAPGAEPAQLEWAGAIPVETARRIACDATVTPVTVDGAGTPLDVGRSTRVISGPLRKALAVRDRGCRFLGCNRPIAWTEAHHRRHWADGGETKLSNLTLLCSRCHTYVHEHADRVRWGENGELLAEPP